MSPYTRWREYQIIRSFFQFWESRHKIRQTPMPRPKVAPAPPFRPYIFSRTELLRLLLSIKRTCILDPLTIRTFILFIYGTGVRVHEASGLRVSDIDFGARRWSPCENRTGRRARILPLPRTVRDLLDVLMGASATQRGQTDLVFVDVNGQRIKDKTWRYNFIRICAKARIRQDCPHSPTPGLHDLRHTFAVHCLEAWLQDGKDLRQKLPVLSGYMGHAIMKSTELYLRLVPGRFIKPLATLQASPSPSFAISSENRSRAAIPKKALRRAGLSS